MNMAAFFELHRDLPREGPGDRESLDWAMGLAAPAADATLCDAACGPGGDIEGLLAHVPQGRVVAVDRHAPFVAQARDRFGDDARVETRVGDMAALGGPFDGIWCAGALYFLGVDTGLEAFRAALVPGGFVAFSHPCWFVDAPSEVARRFWEGEDASVTGRDALLEQVRAAGFELVGDRRLSDAAWEAYYDPIQARIAKLRATADVELARVLDEADQEIAGWRSARSETGYLLVVARCATRPGFSAG